MKSRIIERALKGEFVLIAEIGVNYYDTAIELGITPLEAAKLMIREAQSAGIHAVKFQSYKASNLAAKASPAYWDTNEEPTTSQFELFKKFDSFSFLEYKEISAYCRSLGIEFLSTPFDRDSADYLLELMDVYKISSSDLNNLPFIEYQAKKGRPIILSVGASEVEEIDEAVNLIQQFNDQPLTLLHCVLEYPTPPEHANLNKIVSLKERYTDLIIGYSDHTKPDSSLDILKTAYNLGATIIEKHFTLNKTLRGNDHYHAMEPDDARRLIQDVAYLNTIRGSYSIACLDSELLARKNARRSLVSSMDIPAGEVINSEMLTAKRPGTGISPSDIQSVLGKKARYEIKEDTILTEEMFT